MTKFFRVLRTFQTEKQAYKYLRQMRWRHGVVCQKCGVVDHCVIQQTKPSGCRKYRCKEKHCQHVFSDTSGSIFHGSKVSLCVWLFALYELSQKKGITSVELSEKTGVRQKTTWRILNVIRTELEQKSHQFMPTDCRGFAEVDEAYVGKAENSIMIQGIVSQNKARIVPITDRTEATLKGTITKHIKKKTTVITDTASGYHSLCCFDYDHVTLNHSKEEFSKGNGLHSNSMEGFWGNLKKIIYGTHHGVRKEHTLKYIAEYIWKYNFRNIPNPYFLLTYHLFHPPCID